MKKENNIFWIFGILQAATLGLIVYFVLQGASVIGKDTQLVLSILFPLFLLLVEYLIFSKQNKDN